MGSIASMHINKHINKPMLRVGLWSNNDAMHQVPIHKQGPLPSYLEFLLEGRWRVTY